MASLNVNIKELKLKNPVMTASGTFGYGLEFADFVPLDGIGGIIVKGTTLKPREGNDYPRMAETPMGMLNCVGLQNKGVEADVLAVAFEAYEAEDEQIALTHLIRKRLKGKSLSDMDYSEKNKVTAYLVRKGFSLPTIRLVMEEWESKESN